MTTEIRYEHDEHMGGMAWVIRADGTYREAAATEGAARRQAAMVAEFGYFDPTEARQRPRVGHGD